MFDDFGTSVNMRRFASQYYYDHEIQECFEVRKQICDTSKLD